MEEIVSEVLDRLIGRETYKVGISAENDVKKVPFALRLNPREIFSFVVGPLSAQIISVSEKTIFVSVNSETKYKTHIYSLNLDRNDSCVRLVGPVEIRIMSTEVPATLDLWV